MSDAGGVPDRVVLGVDVGTTGTKVVAFGIDRPWQRTTIREYALHEPVPGHQVHDPDEVIAALLDAVGACVADCGSERIEAVSVSSAMHGLVGLDASMRPLTPIITWADARAHAEARELRASALGRQLHARTGTPVHPMSPLTKLMWFARNEPDLAARVRWWAGLKDVVLLHLTGRLVAERSSASGTGMYDLRGRSWDPAAIEVAGIAARQLPEVLPTTATLELSTEAAERTGLARHTPVVVGAADGPLANLGVGAMSPGLVGLSLGTSGAVRMVVDEPPPDLDASLFCYSLTDDAWVVGAPISNGGIVVRWAGAALAPDIGGDPADPRDEELLALAAMAPAGSDGLVMLPYLLAERAPLWDPQVRGAYLGLRRSHGRPHLIRAAVEGVCLQLATIVGQLDRLVPIESVRVTGGAFRSTLWREVLAATVARPVTVVNHAGGSALGAAALALVALGQAPSPDAAVGQLARSDDQRGEEVTVSPELVAVYERLRASVPSLLAELVPVAELLAAAGHAGAPERLDNDRSPD